MQIMSRRKQRGVLFGGVLLFLMGLASLIYVSPNLVRTSEAAVVTWVGGSSTWEEGSNWSSGSIPGSNDDVVIDASVTVSLNGPTEVQSLTLGNSSGTTTPTLNFLYDALSDGALVLSGGDMVVHEGAVITHGAAVGETEVRRLEIDVQNGSAYIYGSVLANGKGYGGGSSANGNNGLGPGGAGGNCSSTSGGGGGGHGGVGKSGRDYAGGSAYGSHTLPIDLGSGGGCGRSVMGTGYGGAGGGYIGISASDSIDISGIVSVNGGNGYRGGGGGSGGSVYFMAATITGNGSVAANGGNGTSDTRYGGGGSGGRVMLSYSGDYSYTGTLSAILGQYGGGGESGMVLVYDVTHNDLFIKTSQVWHADPSLEGSEHTYRNIEVSDGAVWRLVGYYTDSSDGVGFVFTVSDFTLHSGSSLNGNGYGYSGGSTTVGNNGLGPGGGIGHCNDGSKGGGGAGHGGIGKNGRNYAGGSAYGSHTLPIDLGSGGGCGRTAMGPGYGGRGGGAIGITASGTIDVSGTITVNGTDGNVGGGGGSGGSVYLMADTITGDGSITANGGDGWYESIYGGGGSGGRVSFRYIDTNTYTGTVSVSLGGYGSGGTVGTTNYVQIFRPVVSADSSTGIGSMYAGMQHEITVVYEDADGSGDLDTMYLSISQPSYQDIVVYAESGVDETGVDPVIVEGSAYITSIEYDRENGVPSGDEVTIVWYITLVWDWYQTDELRFGVRAIDTEGIDSGWDMTSNTYSYQNVLDFFGSLSVSDGDGEIVSGDWVKTGASLEWGGLRVVYEGTADVYPDDAYYSVVLTDDGSGSWESTSSSGEDIDIVSSVGDEHDDENIHTLAITDIPTGGSDGSNVLFTVRVDGLVPEIVSLGSITHENENISYSNNQPQFSWNTVDSGSGVARVWRYLGQTLLSSANAVMAVGVSDAASASWTSDEIGYGTWYFHLAVMDNVGLTQFLHITLNVDSVEPVESVASPVPGDRALSQESAMNGSFYVNYDRETGLTDESEDADQDGGGDDGHDRGADANEAGSLENEEEDPSGIFGDNAVSFPVKVLFVLSGTGLLAIVGRALFFRG